MVIKVKGLEKINQKIKSKCCKPAPPPWPPFPPCPTKCPKPCCDITLEDGNTNRIIDDDFDVYYQGNKIITMVGSINPSTSYKLTCMSDGTFTLDFVCIKLNGAGTGKQIIIKDSNGTTIDTVQMSFSGKVGEKISKTFKNVCPKTSSSTTLATPLPLPIK